MKKEKNLNDYSRNLIFADFHIHSRFSRATSKDSTIPNLVKYAKLKGLGLLGTGDFQHPKWFLELDGLEERDGLLYYENFPFLWQTEISLMYSQDGRGRRIHHVILSPNKEVSVQITKLLGSKGRLDYDGRPIFGFSSVILAEEMEKIDKDIEIIPAHIWTPYFGVFGSMSGFDSLKDAFLDKANRIHAIETGMSSDPLMNWRIEELNNKAIISNSDSHSYWPFRLGREATIFSGELSYKSILRQIRENTLIGTVETDPAYGKYHYDGHRDCKFSCSPEDSKKLNNICPKCGKSLVIGVENRVEKLATNPKGFKPKNAKPFYKILPLQEVIALSKGSTLTSKKTWAVYNKLIEKFKNEFNVLLKIDKIELARLLDDEQLADLIIDNRNGEIKVNPGYDGTYGMPIMREKQKTLF